MSGNPIQHIFYKEEEECRICCLENPAEEMETERDISMEIQDIVEDIVGDVLRMADSMETKEGEESSKNTECQHGDPFSRLKLICLSETQLNNWTHCDELRKYPALKSLRIKVRLVNDAQLFTDFSLCTDSIILSKTPGQSFSCSSTLSQIAEFLSVS